MTWLLVAVGNHAVEKVSNFRQKLNVDGASLALHENGQSSPSHIYIYIYDGGFIYYNYTF